MPVLSPQSRSTLIARAAADLHLPGLLCALTGFLMPVLSPQYAEEVVCNAGDVIAAANGPVTNRVFLVKQGEVVLVPADVPLPGRRVLYCCARRMYRLTTGCAAQSTLHPFRALFQPLPAVGQ
jgi:hypothetical protein